ncbi:MAG: ROK family protein [Halocynthiibacter sp.]
MVTHSHFLLADIGGTHARFAHASPLYGPTDIRRYKVADFKNFYEAANLYISDVNPPELTHAGIAVAAPTTGEEALISANGWSISAAEAMIEWNLRYVKIENDLAAQARGIHHGLCAAPITLLPGVPASGPQLILGIGTGFNAAIVNNGQVIAGELGHAALTTQDDAVWAYLKNPNQRPPVRIIEDVLSGRGLENIYAAQTGQPIDIVTLLARLNAEDPAAICAFDLFAAVLCETIEKQAAAVLPMGGIFLCGGMAAKLKSTLKSNLFSNKIKSLNDPLNLWKRVPIHLIEDDFAALHGMYKALFPSL